ncbi:MerR family transcriptional regulator [Acidothermaceae bacterium B102]|nr:MerR family transcriptional regulator [Acidothermaceae bacterium B102]
MTQALTIGDFSAITHLSVRMLRRYHDAGLLTPDAVDPHSSYRYYSPAQVPTAQVIHRLRELGMPVREVALVLETEDPAERAALIGHHLRRLEEQLDTTKAAVIALTRLLDPAAPAIEVRERAEPTTLVAAVRDVVDMADILAWYTGAVAELDQALDGVAPTGPLCGLYDNALFTEGRGSVMVTRPVADPPSVGRVHPYTVPAVELATTLHRGPHDDIDVSYGQLGAYLAENALVVAGPVRETYLVGPGDTDDRAAWLTEIGWPIFRTSDKPA